MDAAGELWLQYRPVLLVADGRVLDDGIRRSETSRAELDQALRLRGIGSVERVRAAVMERNGSISVIDQEAPFDPLCCRRCGAGAVTGPGS